MAAGLIQPCAQARSGPRRPSPSVPFRKSKRSLIKLAVICINAAKSIQPRAGIILGMPVAKTKAVEVTTGINAADNVFGRDANSQARKLFFFTFFIRAKVANILGINKEFLLQGNTSRAEQHKKTKWPPTF